MQGLLYVPLKHHKKQVGESIILRFLAPLSRWWFFKTGTYSKPWHTVDGSEILHQLNLVVYPIIYKQQ